MKNDIWWAGVLPKTGTVGELYCSRKAADWLWGDCEGVEYKQVKLVPIKPKKK